MSTDKFKLAHPITPDDSKLPFLYPKFEISFTEINIFPCNKLLDDDDNVDCDDKFLSIIAAFYLVIWAFAFNLTSFCVPINN